ncbi:MAG: hypothetical protein GY809_33100 [Planctomycetes bacterium]|nr:hypothetical protein [Planctomycetota bacterium]
MVTTAIKHVAVLVVLCSGLAFGASDKQWNLEQEEQRLMHEVEETQARIGQMRVEALEHEAMAKQLAAEAAGLELQMHQEVERRKRNLELAGTEIKVDQMLAEVEQLEKQGHHDEAHRLHAKAEGMAERLHGQRQEQEERDLRKMELEIDELRERSNQAEGEGRIEEAKHLWKQADRLLENLRGHLEHREQRAHMEQMHARLGELGRAMEEAQRKGQERAVEALREAAEGLEREIHERERHMEMERVEQEIDRLHEHAEEAEIQGRGDEADKLREEAEHMEHRLHSMARGHGEDHEDDDEDEHWDHDDDEDEDESLRDEVNDLREQMAHMRELMEEILDRLK